MTQNAIFRLWPLALLAFVGACSDDSAGRERCENLMESVEEIEGPPESVVSSGADVIWFYDGFMYTFTESRDSCNVEFQEQ